MWRFSLIGQGKQKPNNNVLVFFSFVFFPFLILTSSRLETNIALDTDTNFDGVKYDANNVDIKLISGRNFAFISRSIFFAFVVLLFSLISLCVIFYSDGRDWIINQNDNFSKPSNWFLCTFINKMKFRMQKKMEKGKQEEYRRVCACARDLARNENNEFAYSVNSFGIFNSTDFFFIRFPFDTSSDRIELSKINFKNVISRNIFLSFRFLSRRWPIFSDWRELIDSNGFCESQSCQL